MRNMLGINMDQPLKWKGQRNKPPNLAPSLTIESKTANYGTKRTQCALPTLRARRGSFDSVLGITTNYNNNNNHKSVHCREKSSLSDSMEGKHMLENRKCNFILGAPNKCDGKPPIARESKYSINRINLPSSTENELKPILKTSSNQTLITLEDLTNNEEDERDSNGKFCYRLPVSKPMVRKSVSFREETDDISEILHNHVRMHSSPTLHLTGSLNANLSKMTKTMKT